MVLNNEVLRLHGEMQRATPAEAAELRKQGVAAIRQRAAELGNLAQTDPAQALTMAFSPEVIADLAGKFPEAADQLEAHGTWTGAVDPWVVDYKNGSHKQITRLRTDSGSMEVKFAGQEPDGYKCGDTLQATGIKIGMMMVASSSDVQPLAGSTAPAALTCSTTGVQKTVVILATFPGVTPPAYATNQLMHDAFFGTTGQSLDLYWREASYGKTSASGDMFGWYTLASSYTCAVAGSDQMTQDVINTAASHGVVFQNYTRLFIVVPDMGCGWAGAANMVCQTLNSPAGSFTASTSYIDVNNWINGNNQMAAPIIAHEGGHNLGLNHSRSRAFGTEPLGALGASGTYVEYGDSFTAMSNGGPGHYDAPHKAEILNWLSSSNVQVVQGAGTYTILPYETPTTGTQALKIQRGTGNNAWLWVEYRQPIGGFDSLYDNGNIWAHQLFTGAYIHYEDSMTTNYYTDALDFTPTSAYSFMDPALVAGQTWTDPYTNLSISVISATSSGLTLSVSYGGSSPCTHANPTVTMSPANPSVSPGSSVAYSVSVKNNDSSACSSSAFTMGSTPPTGWTGTFSSPMLTIGPGQTASTTLTEAVPSTASTGTSTITSSAVSGSYTGSATVSATVVIATTSLTDAVSVAGSNYSARQTVPMTSTVLNGGVPVSGASVTFTMTKSSGNTVSGTATTDSTGKATWSYKVTQKDPKGAWSVMSSAAYNSQSASSTPANFTVQ